jgi:cytochrome o ubiquinol oxidase subunit IV
MSERKSPLVSQFEPPHVSLRGYVSAFVTCVVITLVMYGAGVSDRLSKPQALSIIAVLAIVQAVVQLRKFLHVGEEFKPRWKLIVFGVMLAIVLILVVGTIWIMDNLNYRMMDSSSQSQEYVESQDGL